MLYSTERRELTPFVSTPFNEWDGRVSPDGKWVAYVSGDSGTARVYLRALSGASARYPVGPGSSVSWSASGRELVLTTGGGVTLAVPIRLGERPEIGTPLPWESGPIKSPGADWMGDESLSPDGPRFIRVTGPPSKRTTELGMVLNWAGAPIKER